MPKLPLRALIWRQVPGCYELHTHGQLVRSFRPGDDEEWLGWVAAQHSFAFRGSCGHLNLHKEARARGDRYRFADGCSNKRYLGQTANLMLPRLEY